MSTLNVLDSLFQTAVYIRLSREDGDKECKTEETQRLTSVIVLESKENC